MDNRIEELEKIKEKLKNKYYKKHENIMKDIDDLINLFWFNNKYLKNYDLFNENLEELSNFHNKLIRDVKNIHISEISKKNENIMKENIDVFNSVRASLDSKVGYKIYSFNKKRNYIFIGDLHSDDYSLKRVFEKVNFFKNFIMNEEEILIFNGDYVDRGHCHLKLLERILIMKYLFPNRIFLLRGNHDGGKINDDGSIKLPYGVPKEEDENSYFPLYMKNLLLKNNTVNQDLLKNYLDFFENLSYIAFINFDKKTIMSVHGGIPRPDFEDENFYSYINSIRDLTDETIVDDFDRTMCQNIMWSDPYKGEEYKKNVSRYHYKLEHLNAFMKKFNVDFLIRGHEAMENGYQYDLENNVITIFSSGNLDDKGKKLSNEDTGYKEVKPKVLKIRFNCEKELI